MNALQENPTRTKEVIRSEIMDLVREYHDLVHAKKPFEPGKTKVAYSGRVFDHDELHHGVDSILQYWLTAGPFANQFEKTMREFFGAPAAFLVNSGSSANLLMVATLCSAQTKDHLQPGDEVITPAVTFPTTLTPVVQHGLIPVFVDCVPGEYDVDVTQLEAAIGPKTRCMFVPHTVGIPCNMDVILDVAKRHNLWLLEDGCDALGATWGGQLVGTFGAMSSISFYPAHHMTMGEGGMVVVNKGGVRRTCLSVRDWGRDCWCEPGVSNTCGKRFEWQLGELPMGYDHKYIYSNLGYNLKVSEMQAALGCAQFKKLPGFIEARRQNARFYLRELAGLEEHLILPKVPDQANPSWFGFPITLRDHLVRRKFVEWLESVNIETRLVFGGNILKQPGFLKIPRRIHGELTGTDTIMNQTLFIGVYPGLSQPMLEFVVERIRAFFKTQL
ncbi:MAG: CDP-4-dehydro-6-deoxyglucose reductase [Chthoniobacter sp.]|jgi:CDP-6-deoxy-D-xylo-4-hexulose-3-dehydrase|nr:CDP-4-dehydro-6-deoxyglucose reductase [Chthoniobacter sp.]